MRRAARGGVLLFGRAMSEKDGPRSSFEGSVPPADPGNAARPGFRAPVRSLPSNQSTWRLFCGIWPAGLQRLRAATGPAFLLGPVCATASQPTYQSINRSIVVAGDPCPRYSSWGASRGRTSRRGRTMLDCGV
ncbi:hypothetical protein DFJ74DRAFT_763863 [Hyaloraphidium curvatum]|nr:hypothetical protein DFJ74DRAFT_763863 [Hyaloraphidium curvatum]